MTDPIVNQFENTWVEVYRAGEPQRAEDGEWVTLDESDLDDIIEFSKHTKGSLIGNHIDSKKDISPYGWVNKMKRDGLLLSAKFNYVKPEFAREVKNMERRYRSAGLVKRLDGKWAIDHIAWMKQGKPRVGGLQDVILSEQGEGAVLLLAEYKPNTENQKGINKFMTDKELHLSEEDKNSLVAKTLQGLKDFFTKETKEQELEMSDKSVKELESRIETLEKQNSDLEAQNESMKQVMELSERKAKTELLIGNQIESGKIAPADKEKYTELVLSFNDDQQKVFVELMENKETEVNLSEEAPSKDNVSKEDQLTVDEKTTKLTELTLKFQAEDKLNLIEASAKAAQELNG